MTTMTIYKMMLQRSTSATMLPSTPRTMKKNLLLLLLLLLLLWQRQRHCPEQLRAKQRQR
jgi:hypothetical protein